jgi:cysteine desulfurase/selenocysteine lyase
MKMSFENNSLRQDFPALAQTVRGKRFVYLDSAATALKPRAVIDRISQFYQLETANVHRGAHYLADIATQRFEEARRKVKDFIRAKETEEIIFTAGATAALNLVAQTYARKNLKSGDEVLVTEMEHHANIVPWQMICEEKGAKLKVLPVDEQGQLVLEKLGELLTAKTKIVAVTLVSNTLGTVNDVKAIAQKAHAVGAVVVVDGAQAVANIPVDVRDLNADFFAFSSHKLFGPYGSGILYGKRELLEAMPPYQGGGSMISEVKFEKTTYNEVPFRFEAGTPHIEGALALSAAIDYVHHLGFAEIQKQEQALLQYATAELKKIKGLRIYGEASHKAPIVSFLVGDIHHSDMAQVLDQEGIAVRAGHHCTQPLMRRYHITGTVRASFSVFNEKADIDQLVLAVAKAKEMLS